MSSSLDYLDLCRLCLVKDRVSVPIFEDEGDVRQIFLKIAACLPVKIAKEDKLPKKICDDCVYKVELLYQFWNTTSNAEKQLLQWLGEVGGLEDKQGYVTEVLDSNVMKQEQPGDNRLDGSVMQVTGHQNNMDIGMMDNMTIITMPAGSEQQFTSVPMDTSGTVQSVPGSSTQVTHDQIVQNQTAVSHLENEVESEEDDNSDDGCDNEQSLPVKEEAEDPNEQSLEPTTFVNVPLPCDEAGPSGLQQQKISEISEMAMQSSNDVDPKTGYFINDANLEATKVTPAIIRPVKNIATTKNPSTMTLYQISYVKSKDSYTLVPIKQKPKVTLSSKKAVLGTSVRGSNYTCNECGLKFTTKNRLKSHRFTHKSPAKLKSNKKSIPVISKESESKEDPLFIEKTKVNIMDSIVTLEEFQEGASSLTNQNKNLKFICTSCKFSTHDRDIMIDHFKTTHCFKSRDSIGDTDVPTIKQISSENTIEDDAQDQQAEKQLEQKELICAQCNFSTFNQDDYDFHSCCVRKDDSMYSCPLCTYECLTRMGLQSHITRKHKPQIGNILDRVFECENCNFKSKKRQTMYAHRRHHLKKNLDSNDIDEEKCRYFCNECDFAAKKKMSLCMHIKKQHPTVERVRKTTPKVRTELHRCDQCDYTNKNRYEVKVHVIRKHSNEYNHECETCGKKYKIRGDLTNHIRFQHREQPIICDVCGKSCSNSNSLYVHQKFAHYKAEFECPICHRRMVSQANLDEHVLKQHQQRERAVCEECGKSFTRQSRLKIHMRIHTGLKPHICNLCSKAFARKTALRQHLLIHTGQRPYICDICGRSFTQKPGLISHRKSHPGMHPPLPRVPIEHFLSVLRSEDRQLLTEDS